MNSRLATALSVAAVSVIVPTAGLASGHESSGGGGDRPGGHCERGGKGYLVAGRLADGSELTQVAGADTARQGDDRFSGTLVVDVVRGNRRGRRDVGLASYPVTGVRVLGLGADAALPDVGTRVQLGGRKARPCAAKDPSTPPPSTPSDDDATAPVASAARVEAGDDESESPAPTTPAATTPDDGPAAVTDVKIRLVVFKVRRDRSGSDEESGTTPGGERDHGDRPRPTTPPKGDRPAPTTPRGDRPAPTTPPRDDRPAPTTPPKSDRPAPTTPPKSDRPAPTTPPKSDRPTTPAVV